MIEWVQLSSGQGPRECERVLWHLLKVFEAEAKSAGIEVDILAAETGVEKKSFRSVLLKVKGPALGVFKNSWQGTLCWRAPSPFRPHHKRQNWFVQSHFLTPPKAQELDLSKVKFSAQRGSGPGGQHVNKSSSAIRASYGDLSVFCHEERSQVQNKQLALARLVALMKSKNQDLENVQQANSRQLHYQLERGQAKRTFKGKI